ncbi:MAG: hypothetical protein HFJ26_00200 [Clostridia bacterium]|nr:hypothetical protein [Clostridia bacterium]
MQKTKSKFMVLLFAFVVIFSTFSFATEGEPVVTSDEGNANVTSTAPGNNARTEGDATNTVTPSDEPTEEDIHNGDLYLVGNDIEMDKLVDGNVYLLGRNINITGKVNGCLYVCGETVTVSKDAYVIQSMYIAANQVNLNGCANDLYAFANKVDMSFDSFMLRDLRVYADTFNFNGGCGRDAFVAANHFNFVTTDGNAALVYGNLTYSAPEELALTNELVQGEIKYQKDFSGNSSVMDMVIEKVVGVCAILLYAFVVFFLCLWLAPKFLKTTSTYLEPVTCAKSLGIGLLATIVTGLVSIVLLFTIVGIPLSIAIVLLLVLLLSVATAVSSICITYKLKEKFAYEKNYLTYLTLAGVVIAIWALELIPYVGTFISIVVKMFGLGVVVNYLFTQNKPEKKEKTETKKEEKPVKKENKKKDEKKKED